MTRIFVASQPGVFALTHVVPDALTGKEYQLHWDYLAQTYYRARVGPGWVLYRPSVYPSHVRNPLNSPPSAR